MIIPYDEVMLVPRRYEKHSCSSSRGGGNENGSQQFQEGEKM